MRCAAASQCAVSRLLSIVMLATESGAHTTDPPEAAVRYTVRSMETIPKCVPCMRLHCITNRNVPVLQLYTGAIKHNTFQQVPSAQARPISSPRAKPFELIQLMMLDMQA